MHKLKLSYLTVLLHVLLLGWGTAAAQPPPAYFVDESELPFTALPGATALWGCTPAPAIASRCLITGTATW